MRQPVPLDRCTRLLNHGPTVLVGAEHDGRRNVMGGPGPCRSTSCRPRSLSSSKSRPSPARWSRPAADGHWRFDQADASLGSLRHVAGGRFFAIGDAPIGEG